MPPAPAPADPHAGHTAPQKPTLPDPHAGHAAPQKAAVPDPHAGHDMSSMTGGMQQHPESENGNPLVDMQTMTPTSRLDDPGIGLRDNGRRVLATDTGFRLRYEVRREIAPYVGVAWSSKWGKTADFAKAAGEKAGGARLVTGLRLWF